jgi:hypothetical protein
VGWSDIEGQLLDQAGQSRRLAFGQVQHQPRQGRGVDDRVRQRAFEAPADQPRVEGIVAVFDEDGALGESKERAAGVTKFGRPDQHRPVDVVPLLRVRVDRRPAVDEGVEKRERAGKLESLGPQLKHQEWCVARRFDIDGHELRLVQSRLGAELGRIDGDLFPRHGLGGATGLQEDGLHVWRPSAERRNAISSRVRALNRMAATAYTTIPNSTTNNTASPVTLRSG